MSLDMKLPWVQVLFRTLLILLLFTLGLTVDKDNFLNTIRPRRTGVFLAFCATLLSTAIVMPLLAVGVVKAFGLDAPSMLAVYVLIACPGGSFSNMAANILGANVALNAALTCACVLISLFMVPIACIYLLPIVLSGTDVAKPPSIKELSINGACVALPLLAGVLLSSRLKRASAIARKAVGVVGLSLIMVISFTQLSHFPPGRTVLAVEIIAALALMWGYTAGRMLRQPHDVCISMMIETAVHDTPLAQTLITSSYNLSKEELAEATLVVLCYALSVVVVTLVGTFIARWRRRRPSASRTKLLAPTATDHSICRSEETEVADQAREVAITPSRDRTSDAHQDV